MVTGVMLLLCLNALAEASSLRLVQLLFRHGDRTPSHTFPNDPYRYDWPEGVEMLTRLGMEQQYALGKYLRKRYDKLLPEDYKFNDTLVRSTDNDRTIQSALAQLYGLYPKTFAAKGGYPFTGVIPIHTVPKLYDQVMKMTSPCPKYKKLWKEVKASSIWKKIEIENHSFFAQLAAATGYFYVGLVRSFYVADVVNVWTCHNLSLPAWVTPDVIAKLDTMLGVKQYLRYLTPEMQRLRGGPLLGLMTQRMVAKITGSSLDRRRLLYGYSAHDSTLSAFLSVLGIFNRRKPPYTACVFVELHAKEGSLKLEDHFLRIYYRNDSDKEPILLTVPGCESDCPLSSFRSLIKDKVPADIQSECGLSESVLLASIWSKFSHLHSILVTFLVLLVTTTVVCYRRCYSSRQA